MKKRIFLTFDMDWACDEVMEDTCHLIQTYDVAATMNVTHDSGCLKNLRVNEKIELGIHPNFNSLLLGGGRDNYQTVITRLKKLVPEAVTARSHSLTVSTVILNEFQKNGLQYDLNTYIPPIEGTSLQPFKRNNAILTVPFIFEDDLYMMEHPQYDVDYYLSDRFQMLKVFNFHPVHLFLNSENMDRYEKSKGYYQDFNHLKAYRNTDGYGIRQFFIKLVCRAKEENFEFCIIKDIEGGGMF